MFKEKLIELLKTDEVVKKDMEELKFWTDLFYKHWTEWITTHETYIWLSHPYNWTSPQPIIKNNHNYCISRNISLEEIKKYYIINNPLQERHLRMYCENNKIWLGITESWFLSITNFPENIQLNLDNTKDFSDQSEEVYEKIFNFLSNKNENLQNKMR